MAPKSSNPSTPKGKKATYEEKGERKASTSSPPSKKRRARTRSQGIHIYEGIPPSPPNSHLSQTDEKLFEDTFSKRKFTKCKYVDFKFFDEEHFEFPSWLRGYSLEKFLTYKDTTFEELLRLFYFYLKWDPSVDKYTSYVKGVHISFSLQEFASILDLPFDEVEDVNESSTKDKIRFLTGNSTLPEAAFLSRELKSIDFRILFNIVCYCIYPRAGGFDKVNLDDIELLYALINGLSMGLVYTMVSYMIDQRSRMNGHLPFGMILTKLFRHFKVNLNMEKYQEVTSYNIIKISTLKRMRLIKVDGHWVDKGNEHHLPQQEEGEEEEYQGPELNQEPSQPPFEETVDPQEGFDHFPFEDLVGSSPHSTPPPSSHPPPSQPTHPPSSNLTPPPSSHPSSSLPPSQVDLTPILSYLESQFSQLNSRVSQIELKVDQVSTDLSSFKQEVRSSLSETQNKLDMAESSFALHCPKIQHTFEEIQQFQKLHHDALQQSLYSTSVALKDLRDNSDRLCLKFKLPALATILQELDAQVRAEYLRSRKEKPPASSSRSKPSKPRKAHIHISDDDSDPFEDKPPSDSE